MCPSIISSLRAAGHDVRVLFLTASDTALVQRFSETRRRHPMSLRVQPQGAEATLTEAIELERELLAPLVEVGPRDRHQRAATEHIAAVGAPVRRQPARRSDPRLRVLCLQAGGSGRRRLRVRRAQSAESALRPAAAPADRPRCCGRSPFCERHPQVHEMLDDIAGFIGKWLPSYVADNRHYVTVAIGCTGGRHRSVYIVEELARRFACAATRAGTPSRHRGTSSPAPELMRLPLFPLSTVLFPGGVLPLRIFEARYMDMARDCLRDDTALRRLHDHRSQGERGKPRRGVADSRLQRRHRRLGHAAARPAACSCRRRAALSRGRVQRPRATD